MLAKNNKNEDFAVIPTMFSSFALLHPRYNGNFCVPNAFQEENMFGFH